MTMSLCEGGKLRLLRPGVLEHWCAGCECAHAIDIHAQSRDGKLIGWDGNTRCPTFGEPVHHDTERGTCTYLLRGGVQFFFEPCWHELRGQSRHLEDFPRNPR
jgi:hypothetical protein